MTAALVLMVFSSQIASFIARSKDTPARMRIALDALSLPIAQTFHGLYAFRSAGEGVGHGGAEGEKQGEGVRPTFDLPFPRRVHSLAQNVFREGSARHA